MRVKLMDPARALRGARDAELSEAELLRDYYAPVLRAFSGRETSDTQQISGREVSLVTLDEVDLQVGMETQLRDRVSSSAVSRQAL